MIRPSPKERGRSSNDRHLDVELVELVALLTANGEDTTAADETAHVERCGACRTRVDARAEELRSVRATLETLVDDTFSDAALDRQRASIIERLSARRDGGRVLVFPPREPSTSRRDRPAARWLAAAAAAGLIVGVLAGQRLNPLLSSPLFGPAHEQAGRLASRPPARRESNRAMADPVLVHVHDEVFLSEMETAVNNRMAEELRALDRLTPDSASSRGPADR